MAYDIRFTAKADQVRRTLPTGARVALAAKLAVIARNPSRHGHPLSPGKRACPFGGNSRGLVIYVDDMKRLITVEDVLWAK